MTSIKNKKWKNIIIGASLMFMLILIMEIFPRMYNIVSLSTELLIKKYRMESNENNQAEINNLIFQNKQLTRQIGTIVSDYRKNKNISDVITLLDTLARKCDVHIADIKPLKMGKTNNLWVQPIDVSFSSSYEGMYNYLILLEKSSKVILLRKISMINSVDSKPNIEINAQFAVYLNI